MKLSKSNFLARAHRFVVRPPPGWADVTVEEVEKTLRTPYMGYKFQPAFLNTPKGLNSDGNVEILNCDFRQGLELSSRLCTAHDVQWIMEDVQCVAHKDVKKACYQFPFEIFFDPADGITGIDIDVRATASGSFADSSRMLKDFFLEGASLNDTNDLLKRRQSTRRKVTSSTNGVDTVRYESSPELINNKFIFVVTLKKNRLTISANMCGEPLYKRGYPKTVLSAAAPLPEHHATAAFLWANRFALSTGKAEATSIDKPVTWPRTVHVPFSGTGTLGIEALAAMLGATPGSHSGRVFSCANFNLCPRSTWNHLLKKNQSLGVLSAAKEYPGALMLDPIRQKWAGLNKVTTVIFSDIDSSALKATKENVSSFIESLQRSAVDSTEEASQVFLSFQATDFLAAGESSKFMQADNMGGSEEEPHHHFIMLNPPFGNRMSDSSMSSVHRYRLLSHAVQAMRYNSSGSKLRKDIKLSGFCLCPDEETWKAFSSNKFANLFFCKTRHFTHGGRDMRILAFSSK